jgi:hypothetical protein
MNMPRDHVSAELLDRYAAGDRGRPDVWWAVEAHLEACPACRDRLAAAVVRVSPATAALLDRVRDGLVAEVARGPRPRRRRSIARLAASVWRWAAPAVLPRLAMTVLMVVVAVGLDLADERTGGRYPSLVLLLAPVAPLLAVAAVWSRGLDPAYEIVASSARAGLDLVLRRAVAVLALVIPALGAAGALVGISPARWLLPCLAFTVAALALGEVVGLHRATTGLIAAWAAIVVGPSLATGRPPVALTVASLPVWAVVTAVVTVALVVRRRAYTALSSTR